MPNKPVSGTAQCGRKGTDGLYGEFHCPARNLLFALGVSDKRNKLSASRTAMGLLATALDFHDEPETADLRPASGAPDAPMNLLLRFETSSGPRTVVACGVSRQVAAEIAEVMQRCGQHARFVDRCVPLSVADRLMIRKLH